MTAEALAREILEAITKHWGKHTELCTAIRDKCRAVLDPDQEDEPAIPSMSHDTTQADLAVEADAKAEVTIAAAAAAAAAAADAAALQEDHADDEHFDDDDPEDPTDPDLVEDPDV